MQGVSEILSSRTNVSGSVYACVYNVGVGFPLIKMKTVSKFKVALSCSELNSVYLEIVFVF